MHRLYFYHFANLTTWNTLIFASQVFRSRSPFSLPLSDWAGISDLRALDFYWMQLLLFASNQIAANNRSRKHHVYAVKKCKHWAQLFYIYLNTKLFKALIGQKLCHLCRLGLWKPLDGDPWELQNPAQSAKGPWAKPLASEDDIRYTDKNNRYYARIKTDI